MTRPTELCINGPPPPQNTGGQQAGEIEAFKALEIGALKWCKEHIPRDGNDLTEKGQMLLEDPELWLDLPMGMS